MVVLASYDGLDDPAKVDLMTFPMWVHIIGLPPALVTSEVVLLVGETLGFVINQLLHGQVGNVSRFPIINNATSYLISISSNN